MKKLIAIALVLVAAACDSDVVGPTGLYARYYLTSMLGEQPPIEFARAPELDADGVATGVMCAETLHSQYIELTRPNGVTMVTDVARDCDGRALVRDTLQRSGSFTQAGDTVSITVHIGGLIGNVNFSALKEGPRLSVLARTYTEADPDGSSGSTYVHSVYQAR